MPMMSRIVVVYRARTNGCLNGDRHVWRGARRRAAFIFEGDRWELPSKAG